MESPNRLQICLAELQLLVRETGMKIPCNEKRFLMKFIRAKKLDTDAAFKMIRSYFNFRKTQSRYFQGLTPSSAKAVYDSGFITILKKRDRLGRKVIVFRADCWDPYKINLDEIMSATVLLMEELTDSETTQRNGVVLLADESGLGLRHFRHWNIRRMSAIVSVLQGKFPILCKGLHSVNEPHLLKQFVSITLTLLSKKLQERVHFHGKDLKSLHCHIPPEILPESLGGILTWEEVNDKELFQRLYSKEEYYKIWNL